MAKKTNDVATRSELAGYAVKDHGHRFFYKRVALDPNTGEMYLPVGFKYAEFLALDFEDAGYVYVVLKDEHLG